MPSSYDADGKTSFDKVEADLRGDEITLNCMLSTGVTVQLKVHMDQDVQTAMALLAKDQDIEFGRLKFFLDGQHMFNPLSFNDFPAITATPRGQAIVICVEV